MQIKYASLFIFSLIINTFFSEMCRSQSGMWATASSSGFTARLALTSNVINDKIYVFGGYIGGGGDIVNTLEEFDPSANAWSTPETVGTTLPRAFHTASVVNGMIYLIGGETGVGTNVSLVSEVDVFDPVAVSWTTLNTSGTFIDRWGHCAAAIGNKIYVFGGDTLNLTLSPRVTSTVQVLDLSTNTWSTLPTNGNFIPPFFSTCSVMGNKIYFTGGTDSTGVNSLNTLEIFDPSNDTWSMPNTLGTFIARSGHGSAVIDSQIFVMGGYGASSDLSSTQVFDPSSDTWSTLVTIGDFIARDEVCASAVDNKIYAMGGENDALIPLNVNEVFSLSGNFVSSISTNDSVSIFPNPTTNALNVQNVFGTISIEDPLGRSYAITRSGNQIDVSSLPSGIYFMMSGSHAEKFVKE